ncbi:unnamed protein product [Polarella glacialis]|uniref:Calmodulin n=1 Tax=Polarella glacialis TaxID=89957 RepID=A0A813JS54_POLGL|nr:unnamed protein product [Polarella glacialis]
MVLNMERRVSSSSDLFKTKPSLTRQQSDIADVLKSRIRLDVPNGSMGHSRSQSVSGFGSPRLLPLFTKGPSGGSSKENSASLPRFSPTGLCSISDLRKSLRLRARQQTRMGLEDIHTDELPADIASGWEDPNLRPVRLSPKEYNALSGQKPEMNQQSSLAFQAQSALSSSVDHFPDGSRSEGMPPGPRRVMKDAGTKPPLVPRSAGGCEAEMPETGAEERNPARKPTEEERLTARSRHKKTTATLDLEGKQAEKKEALPAPSTTMVAEIFPSVEQALERFYNDSGFTSPELRRIQTVFNRFAGGEPDVSNDLLHQALLQLGFLMATEASVEQLAKETTEYDRLDCSDFIDFVDRFVAVERSGIQEKLSEWESEGSKSKDALRPTAADNAQRFMRLFGVACTKESISEIIELAGLSDAACDSREELVRFLAGRRACEGFTQEDITAAREAFDECDEDTHVTSEGLMAARGRLIAAEDISNGLLNCDSLYCAEHLRKLMTDLAPDEGEKPASCGFWEFLVCARRLREMQHMELTELFEKEDTDEDNLVSVDELKELIKPLGFTLMKAELEALLEELSIAEDAFIDFDAVWSFVLACREHNGFTEEEAEEFTGFFNKFCDESGEMPNLAVFDLLRYMGHTSTLEEVAVLVEKVDFNGNGTMDSGEFLRLMRLQKEQNLVCCTKAYDENELGEEGNSDSQTVHTALQGCDLHVTMRELESLRKELQPADETEEDAFDDDAGLSFDDFARLAKKVRSYIPVQTRKRAYFQEEDIATMGRAFKTRDPDELGHITVSEMLFLVADLGMNFHTHRGRTMLYTSLDNAREAARNAQISEDEIGNPGTPRVFFMPVVHFIRGLVKQHEDVVNTRQGEIMKQIRFSSEEVVQFKELFHQLACGTSLQVTLQTNPKAIRSRRHSVGGASENASCSADRSSGSTASLGQIFRSFTKVERISGSDVVTMMQPLGFKLTLPEKAELTKRLAEVDKDGEGLDFPGFLEIMQWMVESNFGGVIEKSAVAVKKAAN